MMTEEDIISLIVKGDNPSATEFGILGKERLYHPKRNRQGELVNSL